MNNIKDDGGAAFPMGIPEGAHHGHSLHKQQGMSLRDYFAAAALQGFCACPITVESWQRGVMAEQSYLAADAMIQARKEGA